MTPSVIVHHHTIITAKVSLEPEDITCAKIVVFLNDLVAAIEMQKIFEPIAIDGKFGFTGVVGIVTSHIAFHYFDQDRSLQFDVYSCKEYNIQLLLKKIDEFWGIEYADVLFLERDRALRQRTFVFKHGQLINTDS